MYFLLLLFYAQKKGDFRGEISFFLVIFTWLPLSAIPQLQPHVLSIISGLPAGYTSDV